MEDKSWTIYWDEFSMFTYLYGSIIEFRTKNEIAFKNELMPPGTVIKRWFSRTNYQSQRVEPTLPIIDGERSYSISFDISGVDPEKYMFRLVYYDRFGGDAGDYIIHDTKGVFKCPMKTYSYEVQLISAGLTEFVFHSFTITELEDVKRETEKTGQKGKGVG